MGRIFINYRRQDAEGYVGRLYDHLLNHFDREDMFMDVDSIQPGANFARVLEDAVAGCDVFIAVIGPQWLHCTDDHGARRLDQWNDFVRIEIATALKHNKLIIPLLVGRAKMPPPADLPEDIRDLVWRNAYEISHMHFGQDVEKLATTITELLPSKLPVKAKSTPEIVRRKAEALKVVRDDLVNATTSPLYKTRIDSRSFPVLGDGNPDARIMFIGESPGRMEAERGIPFCGPSGEILDEMLDSIGLKRADVYLTNVVLDRPEEKREPTPEELIFYTPFLDRLIDIIRPSVIATLGRFAMDYVMRKLDLPEKSSKITAVHGKLMKTQIHYGEIHVIPLFHPAVVLYSPVKKETLRQDFEKLKLFI